ncbi:MAG: ABC transporter substrate-binding protein [Bacteroidales bacterium]|nr:ABC transporter substrate-binding protein [Bacteroidales bacterium]
MKKLVLLLTLLFFAVFSRAQDRIVFTPQWTAQAQFAGYYVAQEKGFYRDVGVEVEIVHPSATLSALNRIRRNESQATTLQLCQAMEIIDSGIPLVNILQTSMNNAMIIASRRDVDPLSQKGVRVGIWSVGFGQLAICMSEKEGLDYEWIRSASNVNLFVKGAIDATLAMSYSEYYQLVQAGYEFSDRSIYRFCDHGYNVQEDGVYMTRQYYERHKEQARKFSEASRRGWEWASEHPEETLDIVMKYVRENHIATNRTLQRLMLQEVLRLQVDRESGAREYRLRPDMVKLASDLMVEYKLIGHEVTFGQLTAE